MSSTTNLVMERMLLRSCLALLMVTAACGSDNPSSQPDAPGPCKPPANSTAPTYTELYTKYFAANTQGHCANDGCHLDSSNGWTCGTSKDTCYNGMVATELINPNDPKLSRIGDPKSSPIRWLNPAGPMPEDNPTVFPEGRDAILAWVAACAQNN